MAHKDIRIKFEVDGRRYEAVGFLRKGEPYVSGDKMLARTSGENGGAIGDEDEAFLLEHCDQLPKELRPCWLVTNRRYPVNQRGVSCFGWDSVRWCQYWDWLGRGWDVNGLVVRRCA